MAWHTTKDPLRQRAYFLKGVQQLAWWPGRVVHDALQQEVLPAIQKGRWPSADQIVLQARDLAERQFRFSERAGYRTMSKADAGDYYRVLAPHYFEELGCSWSDVQEVSDQQLRSMPVGEPLPLAPGTTVDGDLVRGDSDRLYLFKMGQRCLVVDPNAFFAVNLKRYKNEDVARVPENWLAGWPEGEAIR